MLTWAWISRPACSAMAATTLGWQCPVDVTAIPLVKSRYSSPVVVVTTQPRPEATSRSVTRNQTSETWLTPGILLAAARSGNSRWRSHDRPALEFLQRLEPGLGPEGDVEVGQRGRAAHRPAQQLLHPAQPVAERVGVHVEGLGGGVHVLIGVQVGGQRLQQLRVVPER